MFGLGLPLRRIALSLLVAAATLTGASGLARAEPVCQVIGLRGTATLERAGAGSALATGAELSTGDWIATDAGARVKLRFADGSQVHLGENTRLRIDLAKFNPAEGRRNILLDLPMGLLRAAAAKLPSATGSSFEIHTGVGYSAVRGTQWIMVAASEETRVYVQEGRVSVGTDFPSTQFPKLVKAGYWVVVRKTGIETIEASPPGLMDSLIEQTEAAVNNGAPETDSADATETTEQTTTDAASTAPEAESNEVDPAAAPEAAATSKTAGSLTSSTDSTVSAGSGGSSSAGANGTSNGSSGGGSNGGSSGSNSTSNGGGGSKGSGGSSLGGGSGKSNSGGGSGKSLGGGSGKLK
ncbi:FecR family protein [Dongia sedimenti]|uniref:FecR family protein n=1 Tax=Dongia sedimenti TaxID=3064282 RepID=A0ABU0YI28_9PROT|nr:FecR family protein [Rhodospirillaceae bacterium R-7]